MRRADYSRSDRLGELYDEVFYRPAWDAPLFGRPAKRQDPDGMVQVRDLRVHPVGAAAGFNPFRDNAGREQAPVPVLIVNATSLNTGHAWRFEAVRMGEYPRDEDYWVEIDKNKRLEVTDWEHIAPHQRSFERLRSRRRRACPAFSTRSRSRTCSATSSENARMSCAFSSWTEASTTTRASARSSTLAASAWSSATRPRRADMDQPSTRIPATVTRATSGIDGDRVREEQLSDVRRQPGRSGVIDLRKGLPALVVPPVPDDNPDTTTAIDYGPSPTTWLRRCSSCSHSHRPRLVQRGRGVRAGRLRLRDERRRILEEPGITELAAEGSTGRQLQFTRVLDYLRRPPKPFLRQLAIAQKRFGKPFKLSARAKLEAIVAALVALAVVGGLVALVIYLLRGWLGSDIPAWGAVVAVPGFGLIVAAFVVLYLKRAFRSRTLAAFSDRTSTAGLSRAAGLSLDLRPASRSTNTSSS